MQHEAESNPAAQEHACCHSDVGVAVHDRLPTCLTDMSTTVGPGEIVVLLGSETAPLCDRLAPLVGPQGRVIGIGCQDMLLTVARQRQSQLAQTLRYANVEFRRGRLHDLQLDLDQLEASLQAHPAITSNDWLQTQAFTEQQRQSNPLVASDSIDAVISEGAVNQLLSSDRPQMLAETYRVLKRGGRVVISTLVSDEDVPFSLQNDLKLWTDGVSGAYREDRLLAALESTGFYGIEIVARQPEPQAAVAGIEFCRLTVIAFKGKAGPCFERHQAVIYNGPWKAVIDDDGHTLYRGKRMAVCDKTFQIYSREPYADAITLIPPVTDIPLAQARPFNCQVDAVRDPRETKGTAPEGGSLLQISGDCGASGCC